MVTQKVVLDTNIFISALGWNGKPKEIFLACVRGEYELVTSSAQIEELQRVLDYPKFSFSQEQKQIFMAIILEIATFVEILGNITIIKDDPDDDVILETALVGNASYIITGDPHLLNLKEFGCIKIVTAHDFLEK